MGGAGYAPTVAAGAVFEDRLKDVQAGRSAFTRLMQEIEAFNRALLRPAATDTRRAIVAGGLTPRDARWYKPRNLQNSSRGGTGVAQTEAELLDNPVAGRPTLILRSPDFHSITEAVAGPVERPTPIGWWLFFLPSLALLGLLGVAVSWLFWEGIGVWGLNIPVGWAWDITNFVFWVGIGHAGTLISAILFLFRQKWRTSINRAAEAMTIFAVMCALTFPGIHVGRVWVAYWMFPIPNQMGMWPNFRSPLLWDVFAVSVYGTVSVLFWYVGLIPDLATMRDRAKTRTPEVRLRPLRPRLARLRCGTGTTTRRPTCPRRPSRRRWSSRCTRSSRWTSRSRCSPAGTRRSSRPTSSPAPSSPGFAMVLTLMVICRKALRPRAHHHAPALRLHGEDHARHRHDGRLRLRHGVLHRLVQRQPLRDLHLHEPRARARTPGPTGR